MPFAAVICASHAASDPSVAGQPVPLRAGLHFAGNSLVEYQARQAAEAGASQVMILIGSVTQPLSRAVDRLTADGIVVTLIRDMVTLVREAPRDRDMLLVGDGAIVAQQHFTMLAQQQGNALLVVGDSRATANFERIDATQRWGGLLRVSPDILFGTLDMLGDWDLESTLLRAAVQADAARLVATQEDVLEGRVALIDSQNAADLVSHSLLGRNRDQGGSAVQGGVEHYLLSHAASAMAPPMLRGQVPAQQVRIAATALGVVGIVAILLSWPGIGLILMLGALTVALAADRLALLARRSDRDGWMGLAPAGVVLLGIAVLGSEAGLWLDGLYLGLLTGIGTIAARRGGAHRAPWAQFTPGSAVMLLLIALLIGYAMEGFALAMLCAIASVGVQLGERKPA